MALILRPNPAPLSGALFVKNPRRRTVHKNRKAMFGGLFGMKHNRKRRSRKAGGARKSGVLARLLARFKMKKNAGYMLNRKRRGSARRRLAMFNPGYMLNRKRRSRINPMKSFMSHGKPVKFFARKNPGYNLNRHHMMNRRRRNPSEGGGGFTLPILAPIKSLISKIPFVGHPVAQALGYIAFGAAAGATHYYGLKAVRYVGGMLPAPVQSFARSYLAPVGYSLTGVLANFAIQRLPIPFISDDQKRKLGIAAMIAGGVLDAYRAVKGQSSDLGDSDFSDFGDSDFGDGGAYDVVPLGGIGMDGIAMGAIGMGAIGMGAMDAGDYSDACAADAQYCGPDLNAHEGEAAMYGAPAYRRMFGPPAVVHSRSVTRHSRHAGKPGHRWAWLVKLIGWDRFGKLAAMEPNARVALLAQLRTQALSAVDASSSGSSAAAMGAIGMGSIGMSGIGMGGIGQSFGQNASEGMGDLGFMSAGAAY